jgi:lipopolysaccharide biosynthesis protein
MGFLDYRSLKFYNPHRGAVADYSVVSAECLNKLDHTQNIFHTVIPSWDNTARTGMRSLMMLNVSPNNYQSWLASAIQKTKADFPNEERFVFINAWNEWAEGCHLEPDREYGHQFLQATFDAKLNSEYIPEMKHVYKPIIKKPKTRFIYRTRSYILDRPILKAILRPLWKIYEFVGGN